MEDALQKIARGLIALGWLFAVVASSYILSQSTNMNDNNVEYTIGLNHSSSSTRSYELVIGAPLLDHNDVHWEIKGNSTVHGDRHTLCHGSFGFDDIKDMFDKPDPENLASKFTGNTAIATVSVGPSPTQHDTVSAVTLDSLFSDQLKPGHTIGTTQITAACSAANTPQTVSAHLNFDACPEMIQVELSTSEDTPTKYNGSHVEAACADDVMTMTQLSSSGIVSTALAFAMDVGLKSLHLIDGDRCDKTKFYDDESKAQEQAHTVMFLTSLTLIFSTVFGIYFVYQAIGDLCRTENAYMFTQIDKKAEKYFGFITSLLIAGLLVTLFITVNNLLSKMDTPSYHKDDNCPYSLSSDFKSHKDVIYGLVITDIVLYGLSLIAFAFSFCVTDDKDNSRV